MASYETIPKEEAEPLVAPKAASPKFKAVALALCLASAVAGYHAPAAIKSLSFASGNGNMPDPKKSVDVQICLASDPDYCLGVPDKGDSGFTGSNSYLTVFSKSTPKQGIQRFTYEEYDGGNYRLRFKSKNGKYNGCVALYGRNNGYSNGGSKLQMQTCVKDKHSGGQRQEIHIPGWGNKDATGTINFYLTNNLCIGSTDGRVGNNEYVFSDQCRTNYKIKFLGGGKDTNPHCASWASQGECYYNPDYMLTSCGYSCGQY